MLLRSNVYTSSSFNVYRRYHKLVQSKCSIFQIIPIIQKKLKELQKEPPKEDQQDAPTCRKSHKKLYQCQNNRRIYLQYEENLESDCRNEWKSKLQQKSVQFFSLYTILVDMLHKFLKRLKQPKVLQELCIYYDQISSFVQQVQILILFDNWFHGEVIEHIQINLIFLFKSLKNSNIQDRFPENYICEKLLQLIICIKKLRRKSILFCRLFQLNIHSDTSVDDVDQIIEKIQTNINKARLAEIITFYVNSKEKQLQQCLNCQGKFPFYQMEKHIKICKQKFELEEEISKIDAQINAKMLDLNSSIINLKKLLYQKNKDKEIKQKDKAKRGRMAFRTNKILRKTTYQICNQFKQDINRRSDSQSSSAKSTKGPQKKISELDSEELNIYIRLLDQIKNFGFKLKNQTEGKKYEIYRQLKNIKISVKPKLERCNVQNPQLDNLIRILISRMKCMENLRKFQNGLHFQFNQFQNFNSQKTIKERKLRDRKLCQGSENGYCSDQNSPHSVDKTDIGLKDFKIIKPLGKGRYGQVFLVVKKKTHIKYAMKKVQLQNSKDYTQYQSQEESLKNEFSIFSIINNPFLVKAVYSFNQANFHYFVMEYMPNGDFFNLLCEQDRIMEGDAKLYLAEIALGIHYLHQKGIVHRDIKPQNIVIDKNGHIKLADYGLSEPGAIKRKIQEQENKTYSKFIIKQMQKKPTRKQQTIIVGSRYYMAPQVLNANNITKMSDWWSYGILIYHTLLGDIPFKGQNLEKMKQKIMEHKIWPPQLKFGDDPDEMLSYQAKDIIQKFLEIDPKKRLGNHFEDIRTHNFFDGMNWDDPLSMTPAFNFDKSEQKVSQGYSDSDSLTDEMNLKTSSLVSGNKNLRKMIRRDLLTIQNLNIHKKRAQKYKFLLQKANRLKQYQ